MLPAGVSMRLNVATAFDCPFDGRIDPAITFELLDALVDIMPDAEICPCDTTGRVSPDRVSALLEADQARYPQARYWAYHGHDTYGLGLANVLAAWRAGIDVIDCSFAGWGGCQFAQRAHGHGSPEGGMGR